MLLTPYTFTARQLDEVSAALKALLDGDLLDEKEKVLARRLVRQLGEVRRPEGEDYSMVHISEEDNELLQGVMASLWRR